MLQKLLILMLAMRTLKFGASVVSTLVVVVVVVVLVVVVVVVVGTVGGKESFLFLSSSG